MVGEEAVHIDSLPSPLRLVFRLVAHLRQLMSSTGKLPPKIFAPLPPITRIMRIIWSVSDKPPLIIQYTPLIPNIPL